MRYALKLFAVGTRNRPELLDQSVTDLLRALSKTSSGQPAHVLVLDDSDSIYDIRKNRGIADTAGSGSIAAVEYVGIPEKSQLIAEIATRAGRTASNRGVATGFEDALQFACLERNTPVQISAPGRNRNAALLRAAGNRLVSIDDDALFRFSELNASSGETERPDEALENGSLHGTLLVGTFSNHDTMMPHLRPYGGAAADKIFDALNLHHVPVAMTGICGNRWYERPSSFLHIPQPLREHCFFPRSDYYRNRLGPFAILQSPRRLIDRDSFLVTCCHGVDARILLPPFPPLGHADDTIFGWLVRYCYPGSTTAHLPFCVHHVLGDPRLVTEDSFSDSVPAFATVTRFLLRYIAGAAQVTEDDPADRLRMLGQYLCDLSRASHADWLDLTHELYVAHSTGEIDQLSDLLDRYRGEPSWWARDLEDHIERLIEQSAEPLNSIPRELSAAGLSPEEATEFHRHFCNEYGILMTQWPEIWQIAREMNDTRYKENAPDR